MCQNGCEHSSYWSGNCRLPGPCPYEMTNEEAWNEGYFDCWDEDGEADYRHENLEALKRREGV